MAEPTFAEWLRHRALAAGYDLDGARGAQAALAKATGISTTQIGRTLSGQTKPDVQSQLRLARVLRVPFPEMLIRSGFAEPSDFPDMPQARRVDVYEAAEQWGIGEHDVPILDTFVRQLQERRLAIEALDAHIKDIGARFSVLSEEHPEAGSEAHAEMATVLMELGRLSRSFKESFGELPTK